MAAITLLVADDEPIVQAFIRRYVQERDLPVSALYEATNGREAIDLALSHAPDLILLDIRMPGINGLEAAAAILEKKPGARIVMVTAYDEFEYARSALRLGISDYLLKPLDPEALARQVWAALRAKTEPPRNAEDFPGSDPHPLVRMVRQHVDNHLNENLRLEDIAGAVHLSPSHCSRTFSRYAGMSISEFVSRRRLEKAMDFLEKTHMSITDIAGTLGFSSSAYFASWFKRATGLSPLQYRKARRERNTGLPFL